MTAVTQYKCKMHDAVSRQCFHYKSDFFLIYVSFSVRCHTEVSRLCKLQCFKNKEFAKISEDICRKCLGTTALKEQSGKYIYSLCCRESSEKIDTALMSVQRIWAIVAVCWLILAWRLETGQENLTQRKSLAYNQVYAHHSGLWFVGLSLAVAILFFLKPEVTLGHNMIATNSKWDHDAQNQHDAVLKRTWNVVIRTLNPWGSCSLSW